MTSFGQLAPKFNLLFVNMIFRIDTSYDVHLVLGTDIVVDHQKLKPLKDNNRNMNSNVYIIGSGKLIMYEW